jgi:hypothetical protein
MVPLYRRSGLPRPSSACSRTVQEVKAELVKRKTGNTGLCLFIVLHAVVLAASWSSAISIQANLRAISRFSVIPGADAISAGILAHLRTRRFCILFLFCVLARLCMQIHPQVENANRSVSAV